MTESSTQVQWRVVGSVAWHEGEMPTGVHLEMRAREVDSHGPLTLFSFPTRVRIAAPDFTGDTEPALADAYRKVNRPPLNRKERRHPRRRANP